MNTKKYTDTFLHLLLALAILLPSSCGKLPQNGKFDGFWQLMQIEESGKEIQNVKDKQRFWAVQLDLLNLRSMTESFTAESASAFCRFNQQGNTLTVSSIYLHPNSDRVNADDVLVTEENTELFRPFGIWGNKDNFVIEELTSKRMVLRSKHCRLVFRKF